MSKSEHTHEFTDQKVEPVTIDNDNYTGDKMAFVFRYCKCGASRTIDYGTYIEMKKHEAQS